jgi:hypothetical protein
MRLRAKVAAILTPEQKALIEKINAAYAAAAEETATLYSERFASVKGDDAARHRIQEEKNKELEEQFRRKLGSILTANQTKALNGAADEEQQRAASEGIRKKEAPVK